MSEYKTLDELIVRRVAEKGIQFTPLFCANAIQAETRRLGTALNRDPYRVRDGRLQALKRLGQIAYSPKTGWRKQDPIAGEKP